MFCHQQVLFTSSRGTFWIGVPLISRIRSPTWMEFLTSGLMHSGSTLNTRTEAVTWVTGAAIHHERISTEHYVIWVWRADDRSFICAGGESHRLKAIIQKDWCLKYWLTFPFSIVRTFPLMDKTDFPFQSFTHLHFVLFLWWWSYTFGQNSPVLHVLRL